VGSGQWAEKRRPRAFGRCSELLTAHCSLTT
jgi:ribosomal protein L22